MSNLLWVTGLARFFEELFYSHNAQIKRYQAKIKGVSSVILSNWQKRAVFALFLQMICK